MGNFWLNFVITEAVTVASAFIDGSNIKPGLKAALEKLIAGGNEVVAAIRAGI